MDSKGYYKTLGLSDNASDADIKRAYRKMSLKYHPDKQAGKSDAEKKAAEDNFKKINEAYQVLSDTTKKSNYDQFGDENGRPNGGFGGGFGGFDDIFSSFFGGGNRGGFQRQPETGSPIRMNIPLSIEDVYNGCTKKVKYMRNVRCVNCHGAGGSGRKTCLHCGGTGTEISRQMTPMGFIQTSHTCTHCNGKGYTVETQCPTCHGTGFKKEETTLDVTFGPGMPEGYSVEYVGKGNESVDVKGTTGRFLATAVYDFDKERYSVQGLDIVERIYVPYYDLMLGTDYTLEFPDKSKRKITIPSCIQDGKLLRLSQMGIKGSDRDYRGDYYVEIHYAFPEEITAEERNHLEKIKELNQ